MKKVDLRDIVVLEAEDGTHLEYEVVGIVEDDEKRAYAVCYNQQADESEEEDHPLAFIVTDEAGNLLEDEELAQEILDDFFVLAEEAEG